MTREEAINHLKTVAKSAINSGYDGAVVDAVDMAIKALEQEPCGKGINVPATDAISRQAAIYAFLNGWNKDYKEIVEEIRALPPVTPQPKTRAGGKHMTNQEQYERMIIVDNITISDFAKRISDYCKNFDCCADCQFMKKKNGIGCILNNVTPDNWEDFIK